MVRPGDLDDLVRALEQVLDPDHPGPLAVVPPRWPADLAWPAGAGVMVESSGSTGQPKLVALTAAAVRASAQASAEAVGGPGQWLLALPTSQIAGLNVVARAVLAGRAPTALAGSFGAQSFVEATDAMGSGRRYVSLVPTQLNRLLESPAAVEALAGFTAVLVGGAQTPQRLAARARTYGLRLIQTYGMAETCGGIVYDGFAIAGARVGLAGQSDGPSADGILKVTGPMLALGYVGSGAKLRASDGFRVDQDGQRWFLTSDLGRIDQTGRIEVLGRADHVIQTGGYKLAPELLEQVLANHPDVTQVVVTAVADQHWGQAVVALVVPSAPLSLQTLRHWTKTQGQAVWAPRGLGIVQGVPLNAAGKPDRLAAAGLAQQLQDAGGLERLG